MTDFEIRALEIGEEDKLIQLWEACDLTRPWNDPKSDIDIANNAKETKILVGVVDGEIISSVIAGFDGHRGWVYYLAVHPTQQGQSYGRAMMRAAELFLLERNCPKIELMIRPENTTVQSIYEKMGYKVEDRTLMVRWLKEPPQPPVDNEISDVQSDQLPVMVTYLEMLKSPTGPALHLPSQGAPISLIKLKDCTVSFYRYLYESIGEKWLWWEKRVATNEIIHDVVSRETTDQYLLSVGGVPAGWVQIDDLGNFNGKGQTMEIGYLGLFPDFIGRGLGAYLLDFAIRTAWSHPSNPIRLQVNTCTLDHPSALSTYQKAGFIPYKRNLEMISDPRKSGIIPAHIELAQPLPQT